MSQQTASHSLCDILVWSNFDFKCNVVCRYTAVATYKLGTMVDSVRWNDTTDMLAAMIDQRLVVWYYPNVVYVDKDLTAVTKITKAGTHTSFITLSSAVSTLNPKP